MAQQRNRVKELLDKSHWALGAVIAAAVLSFLLSAIDQSWKLYERFKTPPPALGTIEVIGQRGFEMVETTEALRKIPVIQQVLGSDKFVHEALRKPPPSTGRIPMWPVEMLVLNPTKEKLNLHSCQMIARAPGFKLPSFSFGYFVSDSAQPAPEDSGRIIDVEPQGARKARLIFVFADIHYRHHQELSLFNPGHIDIACRDQSRREIRTTHPIYSGFQGYAKQRPH